MEITYQNFKTWVLKQNFHPKISFKYELLVKKIEEIIKENDIKIFYPKNLFIEQEKEPEIYCFIQNNKILRFKHKDKENTNEKNTKTEIKIFNLNNVSDITINSSNPYSEEIELIIKFNNGDKISFNNELDTNYYHYDNFKKIILEIAKSLL